MDGAGKVRNACPTGDLSATTAAPGASKFDQCLVPKGYFYGVRTRYGDKEIGVWWCCNAANYGCSSFCATSYCPGGSVTGSGATSPACPEDAPPNTCEAESLASCSVSSGTFFGDGVRQDCPVGYWCPGGSITGSGLQKNACPEGQTTAGPNSDAQSDCRTPCDGGQVCDTACVADFPTNNLHCGRCGNACGTNYQCTLGYCQCPYDKGVTECYVSGSYRCVDTTKNTNCGSCGNVCITGSTCTATPFGNDQTRPSCVCTTTVAIVYSRSTASCGTKYYKYNGEVTRVYTGLQAGKSYSLSYAASPDTRPGRFVVTDNAPCGAVLLDTGYLCESSNGCVASAPCCKFFDSPDVCEGDVGLECPAYPAGIPSRGGGGGGDYNGAGLTMSFTPQNTRVYVTAYSSCGSNSAWFTLPSTVLSHGQGNSFHLLFMCL